MPAWMSGLRRPDRQHRPDGQERGASNPGAARHGADRVGRSRAGGLAMTSLSDRLRSVLSTGQCRPGLSDPAALDTRRHAGSEDPAYTAGDLLEGEWCDADGGRFLVVDRSYSPGHRHGAMSIADALPPSDGLWPRLSLLADGATISNLLFIDLETTGLAGGAGTYAFLVGCGWFDGGRFRVRQFVLTSFAAERALLEALVPIARDAGTVVTYNGKSFDLPLVETRFSLHRMDTPFAEMPHIDMLHPARRLWRGREPSGSSPHVEVSGRDSCRLSVIEQVLCGHRREGDVAASGFRRRTFHSVGPADPL